VTELYNKDAVDLSKYLLSITLADNNICIRMAEKGEKLPPEIKECLINELNFLQEISQLTPEDFAGSIDYTGYLPRWTVSPVNFIESYKAVLGIG
jgi:hypothetical protein